MYELISNWIEISISVLIWIPVALAVLKEMKYEIICEIFLFLLTSIAMILALKLKYSFRIIVDFSFLIFQSFIIFYNMWKYTNPAVDDTKELNNDIFYFDEESDVDSDDDLGLDSDFEIYIDSDSEHDGPVDINIDY